MFLAARWILVNRLLVRPGLLVAISREVLMGGHQISLSFDR
jgi:hypothetical protein